MSINSHVLINPKNSLLTIKLWIFQSIGGQKIRQLTYMYIQNDVSNVIDHHILIYNYHAEQRLGKHHFLCLE